MTKLIFLAIIFSIALSSCANQQIDCPSPALLRKNIANKNTIDAARLFTDLKTLASESMQGRKPATEGSENAQHYITSRFAELNLKSFKENYQHPFEYGFGDYRRGANLIGFQRGTVFPSEYIVISAHYDHLGKSGGKIYFGADDNASGVSAMLAIADYFAQHPGRYSLIFIATDAEEDGLFGSKAFINEPPIEIQNIRLNINIDMISHSGSRKKLFVAGTRKNEQFVPLINQVTQNASVCLRTGHEGKQLSRGAMVNNLDWREASDHAPFRHAGIPYLYFGTDLHGDYHQPTDTFENIDPKFFAGATETILDSLRLIDKNLTPLNTVQ